MSSIGFNLFLTRIQLYLIHSLAKYPNFKRLEYKYTKLIVSSNGEIELPPAETCAIGDEDEDSGDDHFHTSGEFNSFMIYNNTNI